MDSRIVEWCLEPYSPERWQGVDQAPVFLGALSAGDEVFSLSGWFVTLRIPLQAAHPLRLKPHTDYAPSRTPVTPQAEQ